MSLCSSDIGQATIDALPPFYAAVLSFVVAILVLWTYFDVGEEVVITLDQSLSNLETTDVQKSLINSNLNCASQMDNRTDYLVDLYRTSRFYLMVGFVMLFAVFSHSYFARAVGSDAEKKVKGENSAKPKHALEQDLGLKGFVVQREASSTQMRFPFFVARIGGISTYSRENGAIIALNLKKVRALYHESLWWTPLSLVGDIGISEESSEKGRRPVRALAA